jgi:hypothetical protein
MPHMAFTPFFGGQFVRLKLQWWITFRTRYAVIGDTDIGGLRQTGALAPSICDYCIDRALEEGSDGRETQGAGWRGVATEAPQVFLPMGCFPSQALDKVLFLSSQIHNITTADVLIHSSQL